MSGSGSDVSGNPDDPSNRFPADVDSIPSKRPGNGSPPRSWRRTLAWTIGLALAFASFIVLSVSLQIYASNRVLDYNSHLRLIAPARPPQSLLIFAPHCDDETVGAGGLMYQATHNGCDVHVVVITNGDGFRISVSRETHKLTLTDSDFIYYGYRRQQETRTALKILGVRPDHVAFLGYPDRGLMPMWTTNWSPGNLYRSFYTHADHSPYKDSPTPHAPYCGAQVLADITAQMERDKPTDIYVTHPSDDHPDHAAASVFVRCALDRLRAQGEPWARAAHLHYYLVHRGDWPVPQGLHEELVLPPPAPMANGETSWQALQLTPYQVMRKYAAIKRYQTQTSLTGRFLFSFARRSELFGTLNSGLQRPLARVPGGAFGLTASTAAWTGIAPVAIDPVADTIVRALKGSADIARIYLARDNTFLYVRVDTRLPISPDVVYSVYLRPLRTGPTQPAFDRFSIHPGRPRVISAVAGGHGARYEWNGSEIEMQIPLTCLALSSSDLQASVDVAADARMANIAVDKTGYHGVAYDPDTPEILARWPNRPSGLRSARGLPRE
ncbi:MAG: PIG-L deacetylase family protein [Capsulimonadaceae bacterium]